MEKGSRSVSFAGRLSLSRRVLYRRFHSTPSPSITLSTQKNYHYCVGQPTSQPEPLPTATNMVSHSLLQHWTFWQKFITMQSGGGVALGNEREELQKGMEILERTRQWFSHRLGQLALEKSSNKVREGLHINDHMIWSNDRAMIT